MTRGPWVARKRRRRGFSAIAMIVIMLILGVLGAVTSSIVVSTFQGSQMYLESQQAFYSAQAGLEWVNQSITFVNGTDSTKAAGSRVFFDVTNNTGADITVTGLTATWAWDPAPADDTIFYEEVRVDGGAFNKVTVWDYTSASNTRAGIGDAVDFNQGVTVTLVNGTTYEFSLYDFRIDQTGSTTTKGSMNNGTVRVAFEFTPDSFTVGQGTFTITTPGVTTSEQARHVSTATVGSAERKLQMASTVVFGPLAAGAVLTVGTPAPSTKGPGGEDMTVQVENETGADISVTSFTGAWAGARYYDEAKLGNTTIFSDDNPRNGSGDTVTFSAITISDGTKQTLALNNFKNVATGGNTSNRTSLSGIATEIEFSDGSVLSFTP